MRVSTAQIFDTGISGIQSNQSALFKTMNQITAGRRILTPADDPVGASQALVVTQSKEVNSLFLENQATARSQLSQVESNLAAVGAELQNILEKSVQAGNGALGPSERNMIATELQGRLDNLVSLANAQDGTGQYLYSGFQSQVKPFPVTGNVAVAVPPLPPSFDLNNPYVGYSGDDGLRKLQVDASQEMAINVAGSDVFMSIRDASGSVTGRSLFDSVQNLISNLQQTTFSQSGLEQEQNDLHAGLDNVLRVRASVGTQLNALDGMSNTGEDLNLQYEQRLSELQDVDYAQAITDLSRRQMQLEAAQKSFAQTSQMSLFNFI